MRLKAGTIKRLHVNRQMIAQGKPDPISIQTSKGVIRAGGEVEILGPSKLVYSPDHPLHCGAKLWIETHAALEVPD